MFNSAVDILTQVNIYSIPLIIIICMFFLLFFSNRLTENVKSTLFISTIIWAIFFGYKVYTGNNLYNVLTAPSKSQIEAERYKKVMIDGREVIYDKDTGEVVKPSKKQ